MSVELISVLIAVLAIGSTLGGLILTGNRGLRQEHAPGHGAAGVEEAAKTWRKKNHGLRDDIKQLGDRVGRMEHSQAKLEGLLEGLREAITGRSAAG